MVLSLYMTNDKTIVFASDASLQLSEDPIATYYDMVDDNSCLDYEIDNSGDEINQILPNTIMIPNTPVDWAIAYADGIGWPGFFHLKVEKYIRENNPGIEPKELFIPGTGRYGYNGRADIYAIVNNKTYIWDVKPASNGYWPKKQNAKDQVKKYVNADLSYDYGSKNLINNDYFICETPNKVEYLVEFGHSLDMDGLIFYRFTRLGKGRKKKQGEYATEEETEDDKDPVRKITFPIPSPIPGPKPEPKPNPEFDPEVGTVYESSVFNYVEVGLLLYLF